MFNDEKLDAMDEAEMRREDRYRRDLESKRGRHPHPSDPAHEDWMDEEIKNKKDCEL
jgi:hypothetical protein